MNKNLQNIEDLYKKLIGEHTEMPPATVWDAINKKLDEKKIISLKRKYTDLKKLTAILIVLFITALAYHYGSEKKTIHEKPAIIEETIIDSKTNKAIVTAAELKANNQHIISKKVLTKQELTDKTGSITNGGNNIIDDKKDINKRKLTGETRKTINNNLAEGDKFIKPSKKRIPSEIITVPGNILKSTGKKSSDTKIIIGNIEANSSIKVTEQLNKQNEELALTEKTEINNYTPKITEENKEYFGKVKNTAVLVSIKNKEIEHRKIISIPGKIPLHPLLTGNLLSIEKLKRQGINDAFLRPSKRNKKLINGRFAATVYASPELAFNRMEDDKEDNNRGPQGSSRPPDNRHNIKQEEQRTKSFSSGVLVDYAVNYKWRIQSGISLISKSSETEPKKVFAERDNDGNIKYKYNCAFGSSFISPKTGTAPAVGDSATANFTSNNIKYIGLPINFSYLLKKGKFQISPTAGISFNFLVKQGTNTNITDASGSQKENGKIINGLKSNYINANFGMDISYWFSKKLALNLVPSTLVALSSVNQNSTVKSYPNSFGIRAGLKVNF